MGSTIYTRQDIPAGKAGKEILAGKTWIKKLKIRWDCGDFMVAVQW
jgi:hypothetical protein